MTLSEFADTRPLEAARVTPLPEGTAGDLSANCSPGGIEAMR